MRSYRFFLVGAPIIGERRLRSLRRREVATRRMRDRMIWPVVLAIEIILVLLSS